MRTVSRIPAFLVGFAVATVIALTAPTPAHAYNCSNPPYCKCDNGCVLGCHPTKAPCPGFVSCVSTPFCGLGAAAPAVRTTGGPLTVEEFSAMLDRASRKDEVDLTVDFGAAPAAAPAFVLQQ